MQTRKLSDKILNSQTNACVKALDFLIKETFINNRPADKVISYYFKQNRQLGSRDRRFILEICYSVLRWWSWLEHVIPKNLRSQLTANPDRKITEFSTETLFPYFIYTRIIFFAGLIENQDLIPFDLTIFWAKKFKISKYKLDQIMHTTDPCRKAAKISSALTEDTSMKFSYNSILPKWLKDEIPPRTNLKELAQIMQKRPPMWLRCQTKDIDALIRSLKKIDMTAKRHKKLKNSIFVENPKINLYQLQEFKKGLFEVQDAASQIIGIVCAPKPGERWWDACAGAGGKTLQLAHIMDNKGRVTASDIRAYKLEDLKKTSKKSTSLKYRVF